AQDEYYIPYHIPSELNKLIVQELGLEAQEKIVLGYSQGGYLAPFAAEVLTEVKFVLCLNSSFRYDYMKKENGQFPIHALNGADDDIVDPKEAKKRHEMLASLGRQGDFHFI